MRFKFFFFVVFVGGIFVTSPFIASAADPSVTSFAASIESASSGSAVSFSWNVADGGGYSYFIYCGATGVKISYSNGGAYTCDTKVSNTTTVAGGISIIIINVSGGSANVRVRVIPKDSGGNDFSAGAQEKTVSVSTLLYPISSFTGNPTTSAETDYTIVWQGATAITGVNLFLACKDGVSVYSSSYQSGTAPMPCGTNVFSTAQPASGSYKLKFKTTQQFPVTYRMTLLPEIATGIYDGTHSVNLDVEIFPYVKVTPILADFSASKTNVFSGENIIFSWTSNDNVTGVNFQLTCADGVSATSSRSASTTLPCAKIAFPDVALPSMGSITFAFQNNGLFGQNVTVSLGLVTVLNPGVYDFSLSKNITVFVRPASQSVSPPPINPGGLLLPPPSQLAGATTTPRVVLTINMRRGARGEEVRKLQEFLKKDLMLYPEGLVTSYFGPATERAVRRFQVRHGIASLGISGYGMAGPRTRAKINELSQ